MFSYTLFRHVFQQNVPLVPVVVEFKHLDVRCRFSFAIDTAAQKSIITPPGEAKLRLDFPKIDWEREFKHQKMLETIAGEIPFKSIQKKTILWLVSEDNQPWNIELSEILFCGNWKSSNNKKLAEHLPYCILGQDALLQCGVLFTSARGLLTPRSDVVEDAIAKLEQQRKNPE